MSHVPDGRIETLEGMPTVVFERRLAHPVDRVWAALTDPERVAAWIGRQTLEPHPGGAWRIDFGMGGAVTGSVVAIAPPYHLELEWQEPWLPGVARLVWRLTPDGDGTRLRLEHRFPAAYDPGEYVPGWHDFLVALEDALEGRATTWDEARKAVSEAVFAAYG